MSNVKSRVIQLVDQNAIIPKPRSSKTYRLLRIGSSRGEPALVYELPKRPESKRTSTKRIPLSALDECASQLSITRSLTRKWFAKRFPKVEADGACNFTTVGGVFELLGVAVYSAPGEYIAAS